MKTRTISVLLCVCICLCAGFANAGQTRSGGWNPTPPTPREEAINMRVGQLDQAAIAAMNAGRYAQAEADARQSVALNNDPSGQELLAAALDAQGKDKQALQAYKVIADAGSDQPRTLLPYALLLLKNGQYPQAVAAYNKALPLVASGDLLSANGTFPSDTSQSKDFEPKDFEAAIHTALGLTWTGSGLWNGDPNYVHALDEFQKALQLSPNDALANLYKGQVLVRLGYPAQAHDAFARAAKTGDNDIRAAAAGGRAL